MSPRQTLNARPETDTTVPPPPHAASGTGWRQRTLFELWGVPEPWLPETGPRPGAVHGPRPPRMPPGLSQPESLIARILAYVKARGPAGVTRREVADELGVPYYAAHNALRALLGQQRGWERFIPLVKTAGRRRFTPARALRDVVVALTDAELTTGATGLPVQAGEAPAGPRAAPRKRGPFPKTSAVASPGTQVLKVLAFLRARGAHGATRSEIAQALGLEEGAAGTHALALLGESRGRPRKPEIKRSERTRPGPTGLPNEVLVAVGRK